MIQKYIGISIILYSFLLSIPVYPIAAYSRYVPWLPMTHLFTEGGQSYITGSTFIASADHAYNTTDRRIGLPELYGSLDLGVLSRAYAKLFGSTPLRSYYQDKSIPFIMDGVLRAQGFMFGIHQAITNEFAIGGSLVCERLHAHIDYMLGDIKFIVTEDMKIELGNQRRMLFNQMGIGSDSSTLFGLGNIDLYCSLKSEWEHLFKLRTFKADLKMGLIFPTALFWDISLPATIFTDNNRYWGIYGSGQLTCVLKEDFTVDFGLYIYKKIPKTFFGRMPVLQEPLLFGAAIGELHINPGITILFCPTVLLEHLRNGFGVAVSYSLLYHQQDHFTDKRPDQKVPTTFDMTEKLSSWAADYISLQAFYDFAGEADGYVLHPTIKLKWDLPTNIFVAKKVAKTHVISLTIDCSY